MTGDFGFGFGFRSDDIEDDLEEGNITNPKEYAVRECSASAGEPITEPPKTHGLEDLVSILSLYHYTLSLDERVFFIFSIHS